MLLIGLFRHADFFHHSLACCCCGEKVLPGSDTQTSPGQGMGYDNIQSPTSPFCWSEVDPVQVPFSFFLLNNLPLMELLSYQGHVKPRSPFITPRGHAVTGVLRRKCSYHFTVVRAGLSGDSFRADLRNSM